MGEGYWCSSLFWSKKIRHVPSFRPRLALTWHSQSIYPLHKAAIESCGYTHCALERPSGIDRSQDLVGRPLRPRRIVLWSYPWSWYRRSRKHGKTINQGKWTKSHFLLWSGVPIFQTSGNLTLEFPNRILNRPFELWGNGGVGFDHVSIENDDGRGKGLREINSLYCAARQNTIESCSQSCRDQRLGPPSPIVSRFEDSWADREKKSQG